MKLKLTSPVFLLGLLAFLLSGMPKVRVVIGAPIYFVDVIILYLLLATLGRKRFRFKGIAKTLLMTITVYWIFVILGELRGAMVYSRPFESFYMLTRFSLALSLVFIVPKIVRSPAELGIVVKGLCLGLLMSAVLSICYSIPLTRGFAEAVFSIQFLSPVERSASILMQSSAIRGETLIGTSTFSSGLMAMLWPLLYMGKSLLIGSKRWKWIINIALCLLPIGILLTYGRSAWLSVVLVLVFMLLWGSGKAKQQTLFWVFAVVLVVMQVGIGSNMLYVSRVVDKALVTIEDPMDSESETERFMAYVEPFEHVASYPMFLIAGSGAAQRKWGGNAFGEAESASHAAFGMAYYAYGVGGAICQIAIMLLALKLCYYRLRHLRSNHYPLEIWWRSLLASWIGLLPWWCFGHGVITQPRGTMAFFLLVALIIVCERISVCNSGRQIVSRNNKPMTDLSQLDNKNLRAV